MRRFHYLICGFISFFIGVALVTLLPFWFWVFLVVLGILLFIVFFLRTDQKHAKIVLWILGWIVFGMVRYFLVLPHFSLADLAYFRDLKMDLKFQGVIADDTDVRSDVQYLTVDAEKLFYKDRWLPVYGRVLIKTKRYPEFFYGDRLEVKGLLLSPPQFEQFDYADALAKNDIYVVVYSPQINLLRRGNGNLFWSFVFGLKSLLSQRINTLYTEPEASLVAGLLMGLRRNIPAEILDDFNRAGLSHVLAISGYNITLMITIFGLLLKSAGRKLRFFGMFGGIFLFVLFTGFSASVIRAAWMGFFVILAIVSGRKGNGLLTLLLSGFIMVFLNPRILIFDLSFELSFLATLGLIVIMPLWEKYFSKLSPFIGEGLAVTLAAQVFTTPIILYYFGRFSLISPVANVLFLPLIPAIMFFSFVGMLLSFVFSPLALVFNSVAWVLLKILLVGVHVVAHLPLASIDLWPH